MPYNTHTHREEQSPATCVCNRSAPARWQASNSTKASHRTLSYIKYLINCDPPAYD